MKRQSTDTKGSMEVLTTEQSSQLDSAISILPNPTAEESAKQREEFVKLYGALSPEGRIEAFTRAIEETRYDLIEHLLDKSTDLSQEELFNIAGQLKLIDLTIQSIDEEGRKVSQLEVDKIQKPGEIADKIINNFIDNRDEFVSSFLDMLKQEMAIDQEVLSERIKGRNPKEEPDLQPKEMQVDKLKLLRLVDKDIKSEKDFIAKFHNAVEQTDLESCKSLLEIAELAGITDSLIQSKMDNGMNPVEHSLETFGRTEIAMAMLETPQGGKYAATPDENGNTLVHTVVEVDLHRGNHILEAIFTTAEGRKSLKVANSIGETPMHMAVNAGKASFTREMLKHQEGRETIDIQDSKGQTPFMSAVNKGNVTVAEQMLKTDEGQGLVSVNDVWQATGDMRSLLRNSYASSVATSAMSAGWSMLERASQTITGSQRASEAMCSKTNNKSKSEERGNSR